MKIKYWLLLSYLIVMIVPISAIYVYFILVSELDREYALEERLEDMLHLHELQAVLERPELYHADAPSHDVLDPFTDETVQITLYDQSGFQVYDSDDQSSFYYMERPQFVFSNLYEMHYGHRTVTYRQPVFDDTNAFIGVYHITRSRVEWVSETSWRKNALFISVSGVVILVFLTVVVLLRRKLHVPLQKLATQMRNMVHQPEQAPIEHRANDELGELIHHFEQMKHELRDARESVRREHHDRETMVAAISHDLKTPLTVVRAYAETIQRGHEPTESNANHAAIILDKVDHMREMIDDLSTYSLLRSNNDALNPVRVDGDEFFDMAISGYDEWCLQKHVHLYTDVCISGTYWIDVNEFLRVIDNLMSNAIRHTPVGKQIWLTVQAAHQPLPEWVFANSRHAYKPMSRKGALVIVQNEGATLHPSQSADVFQPFYQHASRGKEKNRRSGLGLTISALIMEKHNGHIQFLIDEEHGTTVICWIPIADESALADDGGDETE